MIESSCFPGVRIRPYAAGDEAAIVDTFNRVFREVCGPGYVDRALPFWHWEFQDRGHGRRISLGLAPDGRVAAQYAGVALPTRTEFGDTTFVHIVDSFVHPEFRAGLKRPGLFVETALPWFEACDKQFHDAVLFGYPVPTAERIGQRYLGYERLRVVDYLCRAASEGDVHEPRGVHVERLASLGDEVDALSARFLADKRCTTIRDARYLRWRYLEAPGAPYELWAARTGGTLVGLMALRPRHELVPESSCIADLLAETADVEARDALLAVATRRAREEGRKTLMTVFADPMPEHAWLRARGFAMVSSAQWLERRLTHRIYHPKITTQWLLAHWWYSLGDTDLV